MCLAFAEAAFAFARLRGCSAQLSADGVLSTAAIRAATVRRAGAIWWESSRVRREAGPDTETAVMVGAPMTGTATQRTPNSCSASSMA